MDKIIKKSLYHYDKDAPSKQQEGVPQEKTVTSAQPTFNEKAGQRHTSSPAHNTRSCSEAFVQEKKDSNSGSYSKGIILETLVKFIINFGCRVSWYGT